MAVFEDAGYYCVDNLPPELIRALIELLAHEGSKVERAAVVSDVRGGEYFEALVDVLDDLERSGLPNPHYVPELRPLTGHDQRVVDYVGREGKLDAFYERLDALLDFVLPEYVNEGKAHLTIAIGCTGGRHRSVAIAEHIAARFRAR